MCRSRHLVDNPSCSSLERFVTYIREYGSCLLASVILFVEHGYNREGGNVLPLIFQWVEITGAKSTFDVKRYICDFSHRYLTVGNPDPKPIARRHFFGVWYRVSLASGPHTTLNMATVAFSCRGGLFVEWMLHTYTLCVGSIVLGCFSFILDSLCVW